MNATEQRAVLVPLLRSITLATRLAKRQSIAAQVGWPVDVTADVAEARRLLRQAQLELGAAQARERFERRVGR
jgi:hypothetical protein